MRLIAAVIAALSGYAAAAAAPVVNASPGEDHVVADDIAPGVAVHYAFTGADVIFSARLPPNWGLLINVDGDQDGIWGEGPDHPGIKPHPTADFEFAKTASGGFCAVYILAAMTGDPDLLQETTPCGEVPSAGSVEISAPDERRWTTETFKIPAAELFGPRAEAHLQICIWEQYVQACRYSPAKPLVLRLPASG